MSYCISLDTLAIAKGEFDRGSIGNLMLNIMAGLNPDELSGDEIALMIENYGEDWLTELFGPAEERERWMRERKEHEKRVLARCSLPQRESAYARMKREEEEEWSIRSNHVKGVSSRSTAPPCTAGCGRAGYVIPAGVFDRSKIYCPGCFGKLYTKK